MIFYPKNIAFGLDIGDRSIKLAELKFVKNLKGEESLVLTGYNEVLLPAGIIANGEIKNYPAAIDAIKLCVKNAKGRSLASKAAVASLPESQCYLKTISLPKDDGQPISQSTVKNLLHQHFPAEENELYYDWQLVNGGKIIIGAGPKNIIDSYTEVIEQAGLIPLSLEIESLAISRALIEKKDADSDGAKILMDLGADHSSIIAVYKNSPILTLNIPLSGEGMTQAIAKSQKLTPEAAEALKIKCGFDIKSCPVAVKKTINDIINSSAEQIKNGLQYINKILKYKFDKIYISGGVSAMNKLASTLSDKLKIKVRRADPAVNIVLDKKIKLADGELLKYVTAIGLAIRGTEHDLFKLK